MGGTLVQLARHHEITMAVLTDGSAGSFGTVAGRKAEQEAAAKLLGATLLWGNTKDCHLEYTRAACFPLAQIIRDVKPDVVFSPHWNQLGGPHEGRAHPDHRALGLLVRDAVRFARFNIPELTGERHATKQLLWYMLSVQQQPKILIPLTDVEGFRALLHAHRTQLAIKGGELEDYLLMARRSAAQAHPGVQYAEGFDSDDPIVIGAADLFKG